MRLKAVAAQQLRRLAGRQACGGRLSGGGGVGAGSERVAVACIIRFGRRSSIEGPEVVGPVALLKGGEGLPL